MSLGEIEVNEQDVVKEAANNISVWKQALEWIWAPVSVLLGIIWKGMNRELKFRREGELALHKKLDDHMREDSYNFKELLTRVDDNHKEIMNHLLRISK